MAITDGPNTFIDPIKDWSNLQIAEALEEIGTTNKPYVDRVMCHALARILRLENLR